MKCHRGLLCLLQKRLADVEEEFQVVCSSYSQALGPNAVSLLEDWPEEILEDHEEFDYESSDDSDFEALCAVCTSIEWFLTGGMCLGLIVSGLQVCFKKNKKLYLSVMDVFYVILQKSAYKQQVG